MLGGAANVAANLIAAGQNVSVMAMIGNDVTENPLMVMDIWEHAYYLDYYNDKSTYIKTFLEHLVNWDFIMKNLTI